MKLQGLPETFWVVTKPTEVSALDDICLACTFERLLLQGRGGLHEDDIAAIFADETEAKETARTLLGENVVRPQDALALEVLVHMMVFPGETEKTFKVLAEAAVEAVENAIHDAEKAGFRHKLAGQITMGAGPVELKNECGLFG